MFDIVEIIMFEVVEVGVVYDLFQFVFGGLWNFGCYDYIVDVFDFLWFVVVVGQVVVGDIVVEVFVFLCRDGKVGIVEQGGCFQQYFFVGGYFFVIVEFFYGVQYIKGVMNVMVIELIVKFGFQFVEDKSFCCVKIYGLVLMLVLVGFLLFV